MYLEDDTDVSWGVMQSWARDTAVLEPLGFKRGLVRTEFHPDDGRAALMDVMERINITEWPRKLGVDVPEGRRCQIVDRKQPYWGLKEVPANCQHAHYVSLKQPYMGMWLATRKQMQAFRASPYWHKADALAAQWNDPIGWGLGHWGAISCMQYALDSAIAH